MVILSDFSEVFAGGMYGTENRIAEKFGKDEGEKFLRRRQAINGTFQDLMRGRMTEDEYWREFFRVGHYRFDVADARKALSENFKIMVPDTFWTIKRICAYPRSFETPGFGMATGRPTLYIVSDHIRERVTELEHAHPEVFKMAKRCIWSFDYGKLKGDDDYFEELMEREHLKPGEVIFIDDDIRNIGAASRVGIRGIQFQHAVQLKSVLAAGYGFRFTPTPV